MTVREPATFTRKGTEEQIEAQHRLVSDIENALAQLNQAFQNDPDMPKDWHDDLSMTAAPYFNNLEALKELLKRMENGVEVTREPSEELIGIKALFEALEERMPSDEVWEAYNLAKSE